MALGKISPKLYVDCPRCGVAARLVRETRPNQLHMAPVVAIRIELPEWELECPSCGTIHHEPKDGEPLFRETYSDA